MNPAPLGIDILPDEVLVKLFDFVPHSDKFSIIVDVCERWRKVVVDYFSCNYILRYDLDNMHILQLQKFIKMGVKLESLEIRDYKDNTKLIDEHLQIICDGKLPIRQLKVVSTDIRGEIGILDVVGSCKFLQSLTVSGDTCFIQIKESSKNLKVFENLSAFELVNNHSASIAEVENNWIIELIKRSPRLEYVELFCRQITFDLIHSLILATSLESLTLTFTCLPGSPETDDFQPLQLNSTIKFLDITNASIWPFYNVIDVKYISMMTALKKLRIRFLSESSTSEITKFLLVIPLSLETLLIENIYAGKAMIDHHLDLLGKRLVHISELRICTYLNFTDLALKRFINKMSELKNLVLLLEVEKGNEDRARLLISNRGSWINALVNHPKLNWAVISVGGDKDLTNSYIQKKIEASQHVELTVLKGCFSSSALRIKWKGR